MQFDEYAAKLTERFKNLSEDEQDAIRMLNEGPLLKKLLGPEFEPFTKRLGQSKVKGFAEGGVVYDPSVAQMKKPDFLAGAGGGQTEEYRVFRNAAGLTMTVRFINGKPTAYIPPGYTQVTSDQASAPSTEAGSTVKASDQKIKPEEVREGGDGGGLADIPTKDLENSLDSLKSGTGAAAVIANTMSNSAYGKGVQALTGKSITDQAVESIQQEIQGRFYAAPPVPEVTVSKLGPQFTDAIRDTLDAIDRGDKEPGPYSGNLSAFSGNPSLDMATDMAMDMTALAGAQGRGSMPSMDEGITGMGEAQTGGLYGGRDVSPAQSAAAAVAAATARGGYTGGDEGIAGLDGYGGGDFGGGFGGGGGSSSGGGSASGGGSSSGGSGGGVAGGGDGTGSDNNGDGFGDMGGISGGWNKGGLVQKPKRKRKK